MARSTDQLDASFNKLRQVVNDYHHELEEHSRENADQQGHPQHTLRAIYGDVVEALVLLENARGRAACEPPETLVTKSEAAQSLYDALAEVTPLLDNLGVPLPMRRRAEAALKKAKTADLAPHDELAEASAAETTPWRSL